MHPELVEDHFSEIQALAATGLLRLDHGPRRVEFRHQTLYEFVSARSFLEESGSVTEAVRTQQEAYASARSCGMHSDIRTHGKNFDPVTCRHLYVAAVIRVGQFCELKSLAGRHISSKFLNKQC
jgi:uncharacterized protein YecE (DUF72 family)